ARLAYCGRVPRLALRPADYLSVVRVLRALQTEETGGLAVADVLRVGHAERSKQPLKTAHGAAIGAPGHAHKPVVARSRRYLLALPGVLGWATVFEGYDITMLKLCTPDIARMFQLNEPGVGLMASVVRFGGMLSFLVVALADRFGRKPVISITVICYAAFTL